MDLGSTEIITRFGFLRESANYLERKVVEDGFFPLRGLWGDYFTIHRDIAVLNDTLWIVQYWPGARPAKVSQISVEVGGGISVITEWDAGLAQLDGIATDGMYLWVSGRTSLEITGQPSNEIKKFDMGGNELVHFQYPDSTNYNYADLTWHKNNLWAFSSQTNSAEIHQIDPDNGQIVSEFATGWQRPNSHINGKQRKAPVAIRIDFVSPLF